MLALGTTAPEFTLPDPRDGKEKSLSQLRGQQATVVMFICNHCPYVVHVRQGIIDLAKDYANKGVAFIAISSNDVDNYPDDGPEKMAQLAEQEQFPFPYLYDETQATAKAYMAACTPDFYVFDQKLSCIYRGRMDGAKPGNDEPVTGKDIRAALDASLAGKTVDSEQLPSMGCNIKWKSA